MAEVFLAQQRGIDRFEKTVVVKRILPHLAELPEFVSMFLDEARTVADLRHPNVVSVFDVGCADGAYYLVMEYLEGQNLKKVQDVSVNRFGRVPLPVALKIVVDAARGLHHAHTKVDRNGRSMQIVHRDVSPHNLMVSYLGVTKVVDFGIARTADRARRTRTGHVRGKLEYMSPEQIAGRDLDAQTDQFSLGVVLYELTTGVRLFEKDTDYLVARAILEGAIPQPTKLIGDYPPALETALMKSLARDPAHRFPDCEAFAEALQSASSGLDCSEIAVAAWMKQLFSKEIAAESAPTPIGRMQPTVPVGGVPEPVPRTADTAAPTISLVAPAPTAPLAGRPQSRPRSKPESAPGAASSSGARVFFRGIQIAVQSLILVWGVFGALSPLDMAVTAPLYLFGLLSGRSTLGGLFLAAALPLGCFGSLVSRPSQRKLGRLAFATFFVGSALRFLGLTFAGGLRIPSAEGGTVALPLDMLPPPSTLGSVVLRATGYALMIGTTAILIAPQATLARIQSALLGTRPTPRP